MGCGTTQKGALPALPCLTLSVLVLLASCVAPQLPPPAPKYVYSEEKVVRRSVNSLWNDSAGLYETKTARRLNDLVTIRVVENMTGTGTASTKATRTSASDYSVDEFFGMNLDFNIQNLPLLNGFYKNGNIFAPKASGGAKSDFDGKGDTVREGKLIGTITAKVVEVMPNGNLVIESRKDLTINNETQILVLRGMIRPDDIAVDNTILSSSVADAQIFFVGEGIIQEKQTPGWLTRVFDTLWPF